MKILLPLGILIILVISTISVSSTITKTTIDINTGDQDGLQHTYNDVFTSL